MSQPNFGDLECWIDHKLPDIVLTALLIVGIVLSYLPQHLKIIHENSSRGISHWYLFLGAISSFSNLSNAAVLQFPLLSCCSVVPFSQCALNLLAFVQLLVQWSMFFIIFLLFYTYYPEEHKYMGESRQSTRDVHYVPSQVESPGWLISKRLRTLSFAFMLFVALTSWIINSLFGYPSSASYTWSIVLGTVSLVMSVLQFLPQIWRTWKEQEIGALSIKAMLMQTPGSFLMCYTIAVSPETNVYTWITYFVGGCLQGCLLLLCISLHYSEGLRTPQYQRINVGDPEEKFSGELVD